MGCEQARISANSAKHNSLQGGALLYRMAEMPHSYLCCQDPHSPTRIPTLNPNPFSSQVPFKPDDLFKYIHYIQSTRGLLKVSELDCLREYPAVASTNIKFLFIVRFLINIVSNKRRISQPLIRLDIEDARLCRKNHLLHFPTLVACTA
jgi:hypothetical protein